MARPDQGQGALRLVYSPCQKEPDLPRPQEAEEAPRLPHHLVVGQEPAGLKEEATGGARALKAGSL